MDGTTVGIIIVIVIVVIVAIASASSSGSRGSNSNTPTAVPPPTPTIHTSGMVVRGRRPGPSSTGQVTTIPEAMVNPVHIPPEVRIFHNQKKCRVCQQSVLWTSRNSGWVRCMATNLLVHKDCHDFASRGHPGARNWCTICNGSCASGQAMRFEGRT